MNTTLCELDCFSSTEHLKQLYVGFGILNKLGWLKVRLKKNGEYKTSGGKPILNVTLNKRIKLFYDCEDHGIINKKQLEACDFYFKRSYGDIENLSSSERSKIHPLGFNYPLADDNDFAMRRFYWDVSKTRNLKVLINLILANRARKTIRLSTFEGYPQYDSNPKILFLTRLWKPEKAKSAELKEERLYINSMRADCIRKLKAEFKDNFVGGLMAEEYALKNYRDCVVGNESVTDQKNYLRTVRESSICIATMGLRKSIGWKMAEYVAGAKAIVSEKLYYSPSGNFENGKNYLEFSTPDECVEKAAELFDDAEKCYEMKKANYRYYQEYLRPDMLVWNSLQMALMKSSDYAEILTEPARAV